MKKTIMLTMAACCAALVCGGCTSSGGPVEPEPPQPDYRVRTSPANTIHNIQAAYVWMNVEEYLDCLSVDFVFYPPEEDVGGSIPVMWYKTDERVMHENMFDEDGDVESITLTLTPIDIDTIPGADPGDPLDDVVIYVVDVDLYVHLDGPLSFHASTPSRFHLRVDTDQTGPGGAYLWEVFKWYDLGVMDRAAPTEEQSWSRIKAFYHDHDAVTERRGAREDGASWSIIKYLYH